MPVGPTSLIAKALFSCGLDYAVVADAEQAYIDVIDNSDTLELVLTDLIGKEHYGGSYLAAELINLPYLNNTHPLCLSIDNAIKAVRRQIPTGDDQSTNWTFIRCGGASAGTFGTIHTHFLGFIIAKDQLFGFTPVHSLWTESLNILVTNVMEQATGLEITWDLIQNQYGPQDFTEAVTPCRDSIIPPFIHQADPFSQTWIIAWVVSREKGTFASDWTRLSKALLCKIRSFVILLLETHPHLLELANRQFRIVHPLRDIMEELYFGYNLYLE
jgi:hypothetical protein